MCERVVSIHGFSAWRGAEGGRSGASFRVCARLVVVVVVAAAACLRDAYPIKIARTRGVTRASRELRAFREANERSKKKALSADDRFTNVTSIRKIFGGAEKKGKNKEKFLKWFRRKKKRESRSGIGREGKVVEEVTILSLSRKSLARIGRLSDPRVLETLFCPVLSRSGRGTVARDLRNFSPP